MSEEPPARALTGVSRDSKIRFNPEQQFTFVTDEYEYTVSSNSHGRRDAEWPSAEISRPDNVLFIGDSFIMGFGVEAEFSIPGMLEQKILGHIGRNVEVFNFGIGGAIALPEYRQLLLEALKIGISAQTILVGIFIGNDFSKESVAIRANNPDQHKKKRRGGFLASSALYKLAVETVKNSPQLSGTVLRLGDMLGIRIYASPAAEMFLRKPNDAYQKYFEGALLEISEIDAIARTNNRDLGIIIIPNKMQVENHDDLTNSIYDADRPNRLIQEYCDAHGIKSLDLLPVIEAAFREQSEPLYYPIDRHFNKIGNAIATEAIASFLQRESMAPYAVTD